MTIPSTIPYFKDALFAAVKERTEDPDSKIHNVQLTYGVPLPNPEKEFIWLGDVEAEQEANALGNSRRKENYTLTSYVSVVMAGAHQKAANERAFEIVGVLEDILRQEPNLSSHYSGEGQIVHAQFDGVTKLDERANEQEREALLTVVVSVLART